MTLDERVKALETKLSGTGWSIEGCGASENYSPSPMALLSKRIEVLEKTLEGLKEAAQLRAADDLVIRQISNAIISSELFSQLS